MTSDNSELVKFRKLSLQCIKSLILARHTAEPHFFSETVLTEWGIAGAIGSNSSSIRYLERVSRIHHDLSQLLDSSEKLELANEGDVDEYEVHKSKIFHFVKSQQTLRKAVESLDAGEKVNWESIAIWECLSAIRKALNSFPFKDNPKSNCPVQLLGEENRICVSGQTMQLSDAEYSALLVLVNEFPTQLSAKQISSKANRLNSPVADAAGALKRLKQNHPELDGVLQFPGKKGSGQGYGLRSLQEIQQQGNC